MSSIPETVAVHPIVLLSVVDHYNRVVAKNKNRRVVGVLLGEINKGSLDITNCYALPFEEDPKEQHIWFVDHLYHEEMYSMYKKINAKEKVVGWYTTGTRFKQHDIEINEIFKNYCVNPVLVIVDPEHIDELALPTEAYVSVEEVSSDGIMIKNFVHLPSTVEAFEPEEIGVEALLREIKDVSLDSLGNNVNQKLKSLQGLISKMEIIKHYLSRLYEGKIPKNNKIINNLQEIFNLLPNITNEDIIQSFAVKNNDIFFSLYLSSMIRSTISLHNLISNKIQMAELEKNQENEKKKEKEVLKENKSENKN